MNAIVRWVKITLGFFLREFIAGIAAFLLVVFVYYLFHGEWRILIDDILIKTLPVSLFIIFMKIISGYYLLLTLCLYLSKQQLSYFSVNIVLITIAMSVSALMLFIFVEALLFQSTTNFTTFIKRFVYVSQQFFFPGESMSKYVYSGILASVLSPFFMTLLKKR